MKLEISLSDQQKESIETLKVKTMGTTEKFCLQWNDFEANISSAFRNLKEEKDFSDVTLVCADQQVEAHKVILAASSPFFKRVLRNIQHSHPLIYMKGIKFSHLEAVLSFVYYGEVNVAEVDLNSFLAFAEELEVKGLTCGKNNHQPQSNIKYESEPNSNHEFQSNSSFRHQSMTPPLSRLPAQVHLQNPIKTEQEWAASENNNACEAVHAKRKSDSRQLVNDLQAPILEAD